MQDNQNLQFSDRIKAYANQFHKDYHTMVIPVGPTEDPDIEEVGKIFISLFGGLLCAQERMREARFEIIEDDETKARYLVGRMKRWPHDPEPDYRHFRMEN